ncbi:MAG: 23S rRNA (uracil-5-)-methyltransferase RumA, partial [Bacteroidota bacterium]
MGRKRKFQRFQAKMKIDGATNDGRGVARHEDRVVFVERAVPGDLAEVYVYGKRKGTLVGKMDKLLEASPDRVDPPCQHIALCGGCKWQSMSYEAQLSMKQQQVEDAIHRIGKVEVGEVKPILGSAEIFHYRNKLEFTFSNNLWLTKADKESGVEVDKRVLGYHIPGFFDKVFAVENCLLQKPLVNDIRNAVFQFCKEQSFSFHDIKTHEGFLRNLVFRSTDHYDQMMVILVVNEQDQEK